nr:VP56 [Grass carp reovirus]QYF11915.1 VP56 [Grass carp reovirus]
MATRDSRMTTEHVIALILAYSTTLDEAKIHEEITNLQSAVAQLTARLTELTDAVTSFDARLTQVEQQVSKLDDKIGILSNRIGANTASINFLAGIVDATRIDAVDTPLYIYIVDDQRRLAIATGDGLFVKDQKLNGYDVRSFPPIAVAKYNDILSFSLSSAPPLDIVDGKLAVSTTSRLFITSGKLDTNSYTGSSSVDISGATAEKTVSVRTINPIIAGQDGLSLSLNGVLEVGAGLLLSGRSWPLTLDLRVSTPLAYDHTGVLSVVTRYPLDVTSAGMGVNMQVPLRLNGVDLGLAYNTQDFSIVDGYLTLNRSQGKLEELGEVVNMNATLVDLNDGGLQALETDLSLEKPLNAMQCLFEHEGTWRWKFGVRMSTEPTITTVRVNVHSTWSVAVQESIAICAITTTTAGAGRGQGPRVTIPLRRADLTDDMMRAGFDVWKSDYIREEAFVGTLRGLYRRWSDKHLLTEFYAHGRLYPTEDGIELILAPRSTDDEYEWAGLRNVHWTVVCCK